MVVQYKDHSKSFLIIFIYAPSREEYKSNYWQFIQQIIDNHDLPFFIMSDFNDLFASLDKWGGIEISSPRLCRLIDFASINGLIDLNYIGFPFTWRKSQDLNNTILERLDRFLIQPSIINYFDRTNLEHLPFTTSDHCCIILQLGNDNHNRKFPFRFENIWLENKHYQSIVRKVWNSHYNGSELFKLFMKQKRLKIETKMWLKHFNNNNFE